MALRPPPAPLLLSRLAATGVLCFTIVWFLDLHNRAGSWEVAILKAFPGLVLAAISTAGLVLIGKGWPTRTGQGESCAACGHAWVPDDHILLNHCQECGACWRWFGGRVPGSTKASPRMIALGLSLLALAPAAITADTMGTFSILSARPRWMLLKTIQSAHPIDAVADWKVLQSQSQSDPSITAEIAQAILQRRMRFPALPAEFTIWMHEGVVQGTLPLNLVDQWLASMVEFKVDVPAITTVNAPIPYTVTARFLGGWEGVADVPQIALSGFTVGDDAAFHNQSPYPIPAATLNTWSTLSGATLQAPASTGPLTVTFHAWLVIGRPVNRIEFDAKGTPLAPDAAVLHEFTWTKTLDVVAESPPSPDQTPAPVPAQAPAP